ncbi:hypothetical protein [Williamsia phyllosphaerae]|uniref:Uncharacterized protein n=1 Tax=Williamsia phyllosphaerae TaxID=885042 RepID=A0ABQ1U8T8_9NOCA|nr:hypothetical protein [Williamsia phyllosphaerae]GGF13447.1 hypothetical protein GCM10007298_06770 [Williamsia phyllosphaerae]
MIATRYSTTDGRGRAVAVSVEPRCVTVEIDGELAEIARVSGDAERPGVPIGTRESAELSLIADGRPCPLTLGRGRLSRRSYRARFELDGHTYTFVPVSEVENALRRGRTTLARFLVADDGRVETFEVDRETANSLETAAGVALATAFGCGARHGLEALIDVVTGGVA